MDFTSNVLHLALTSTPYRMKRRKPSSPISSTVAPTFGGQECMPGANDGDDRIFCMQQLADWVSAGMPQ